MVDWAQSTKQLTFSEAERDNKKFFFFFFLKILFSHRDLYLLVSAFVCVFLHILHSELVVIDCSNEML